MTGNAIRVIADVASIVSIVGIPAIIASLFRRSTDRNRQLTELRLTATIAQQLKPLSDEITYLKAAVENGLTHQTAANTQYIADLRDQVAEMRGVISQMTRE